MYPNIDNRQHAKFSDELRLETLVIWQEVVVYFNRLMSTVQYFPVDDEFGMRKKIEAAGLQTADLTARAGYAKSRKIFENLLTQAQNSIAETAAFLYISQKRGYIPKRMYEQLFEEGDILQKKLEAFSGRSSFSESQLN